MSTELPPIHEKPKRDYETQCCVYAGIKYTPENELLAWFNYHGERAKALEARIRALDEFAYHADNCKWNRPPRVCGCGYTALRNQLTKEGVLPTEKAP